MTGGESPGVDRRSQSRERIEHLLEERRQLLSLLLQLSYRKPDPPSPELLDEFCQLLVDYIAAGHFGLFQRIVERQERRRKVLDLALEVYPRIEESTRIVLDFNEKYDPEKPRVLDSIYSELSRLGEALTSRMVFEDQLISRMLDGRGAAGS